VSYGVSQVVQTSTYVNTYASHKKANVTRSAPSDGSIQYGIYFSFVSGSWYSNATTDIEYKFPFGWGELWGIASRTDFDLRKHAEHS
jgi:hypothetical protein